MTGDHKSVRVRMEGLVQGVGFRAWVERRALDHGLDGWVRNRRDGTVEAVFSGPVRAVEAMVTDCRQGPRPAAVTLVTVADEPVEVFDGFQIAPTA